MRMATAATTARQRLPENTADTVVLQVVQADLSGHNFHGNSSARPCISCPPMQQQTYPDSVFSLHSALKDTLGGGLCNMGCQTANWSSRPYIEVGMQRRRATSGVHPASIGNTIARRNARAGHGFCCVAAAMCQCKAHASGCSCGLLILQSSQWPHRSFSFVLMPPSLHNQAGRHIECEDSTRCCCTARASVDSRIGPHSCLFSGWRAHTHRTRAAQQPAAAVYLSCANI